MTVSKESDLLVVIFKIRDKLNKKSNQKSQIKCIYLVLRLLMLKTNKEIIKIIDNNLVK